MGREVEYVVLNFSAPVDIANVHNDLVAQGRALRNYFTGRRDDAGTANQITAFFFARFGHTDHPCPVLVRTCLHAQVIVKILEVIMFGHPRVVLWCVVAEQDDFCPL